MINIFLANRIKNKKTYKLTYCAENWYYNKQYYHYIYSHIRHKKTLCRLQKLIYFTQPIIKQLILLNNERDRCNHTRTQRPRDP